jgi:hypothetical protein
MLPALPDTLNIEAPPANVNARLFTSIDELLPVLVRKSAQHAWNAYADFDAAALEVFNEADGIHSFYRIDSLAALVVVAVFMTRTQTKRSAAYFFAIPEQLALQYALAVTKEPVDNSDCPPLDDLHRHVQIDAENKERLFRDIQDRRSFNYRVDKPTMNIMARSLVEQGCRDHASGPCLCEPQVVAVQ